MHQKIGPRRQALSLSSALFSLFGAAAALTCATCPSRAAFADDQPAATDTTNPDGNIDTTPQESNDEKTYTNVRESEVGGRDPSGHGFALFGGLGLGYGSLSADAPEVNKNGILFNARATGAYIDKKVIYDVGISWLYSNMKGSDSLGDVKVLTQAASLELSPRYRLSDHWDLGPVGQVLFGTDTSFGEDGSDAGNHIFVGAKLMYMETSADFHWRAGLQVTTDLTVEKRQVWLPMLVVEIGIPLSRNKTILRERETVRVREHKVVETKVVRQGDKFTFDDEVVHFEVDKSILFPDSRDFFLQLGQFLAANPDVYQSIKIDGHTDSTGTPEHNTLLSQDRARAVASVLVEGGVPQDRVQSEGHGQDSPIDSNDTDVGRARNRRVEISFGEGANTKRLHDEIKKIKLRTVKPRTCEGGSCK